MESITPRPRFADQLAHGFAEAREIFYLDPKFSDEEDQHGDDAELPAQCPLLLTWEQ